MDNAVLQRMRDDWDARARENAQYYVQTAEQQWDEREFFRSGEISVANEILPEMHRICGGSRSPLDLRALEIGCGAGRMTRMLARIFGHVTAVDVSNEMLGLARTQLAGIDNVDLILGDGATLTGVADASCDFAFSFIVFQHIPSRDVIASYCAEVHRVLKPGALFKFQVCGSNPPSWRRAARTIVRRFFPSKRPGSPSPNTWEGVAFTDTQARKMCSDTGFILEASLGAGSQYYWLWFRKR